PRFANCFLVIVTKEGGEASSAARVKTIYRKFPENRGKRFRMETDIVSGPEGKYVTKTPVFPEGQKHVAMTLELTAKLTEALSALPHVQVCQPEPSGEGLRYAFAKGTSLRELIKEKAEKKDFEAVGRLLDRFTDLVYFGATETDFEPSEDFRKIFGDCGFSGRTAVSPVTDLDLIFENVFVDGDDWTLIDCEWTFDFPVPVKYVLYRAVSYYTDRPSDPDTYDFMMNRFGVTEADVEVFRRMEEGFQNFVSSGEVSFREECLDRRRPIINLNEAFASLLDTICWSIYYDCGKGFLEETKKEFIGSLTGENVIPLHFDGDVTEIRIDPGENKGFVVMKNRAALPQGLNIVSNGIEGPGGLFVFDHDDPFIVFLCGGFKGTFEAVFDTADDGDAPALLAEVLKTRDAVVARPASPARPEAQKKPSLARRAVRKAKRVLARSGAAAYYRNASAFGLAGAREIEKYDKAHANDHHLENDYGYYIREIEPNILYKGEVKEDIRFSIVIPVYNCPEYELTACIDACLGQTYRNFELILVDDHSPDPHVKEVLSSYEGKKHVKIIYREENGRISRATNDGINAAEGDFIVFSDCDDVMSTNALREFAAYLHEHPDTDFLYSDEDKLTEDGSLRHDPFFKPDWSPDLFWSMMYTNHLAAYRASLVKEIGGLRPEFDGAQDYDMTMRFLEKSSDARVGHVAKVLYHWRETAGSTAADPEAKDYVFTATDKLKREALARRGMKGTPEFSKETHQFRIVYDTDPKDLVSIIIPSKDNPDVLFKCINSVQAARDGVQKEIIVVDNGSSIGNHAKIEAFAREHRVNYIYEPATFNFSAMVNRGAKEAKGNYLLFLNDDTEVKDEGSIRRMLGQAKQAHTGAVGAKLLYPDREHIQHIGIINIATGPSHAFLGDSDAHRLLFDRNRVDYNYLAVTAACLMVSKEKYEEAGGFDEELRVAYNDVDFCFSLIEKGYYNVVRNDAVFLHYESLSRGNDMSPEKMARLNVERKRLYTKHPAYVKTDPFYNRNLVGSGVHFTIDMHEKKPFAPALSLRPETMAAGDFDCTVDIFAEDAERSAIEVSGWYETGEGKADNGRKAVVILKNGNETHVYATEKVKRQDIYDDRIGRKLTGKPLEIITTGFYARLPEPGEGKWELGIALSYGSSYRVVYTGKVVEI
ncbi:MAG: glycosyltransferase, partial [Lachnospiraceae bacterium]|nr:glycosyltransferase [Lachnospiraceae bacterium]